MSPLLSPADTCTYLLEQHGIRRTVGTLAKTRYAGTGPEFVKVGYHAFYRPAALDTWAESIISQPMKSTKSARERAQPAIAEAAA